ncbi:flavodoxin family protein [Vibrio pectenicida]|uniref:Flavodoxin family protein n=1 Tax=Vibrio pectenicida TaxID=62763 RepID=A0A427U6T3_9VIBR|nr:flavodoxin family protein [Vibrio pectenicida]NOH73304.1 flavodoxin family protein [Vibrio pectenicida]RSD32333.1 flavodoxin family protein [Vibrio pectenicida]
MQTLILFSSANKSGNTAKTIGKIHADHECEVIFIDTLNITPYRYDNQYPDDDFYGLIDKIRNTKNIVFASPVYWYSVTAPMKNLIDRITELGESPRLKNQTSLLTSKRGFVVSSSGNRRICPIFRAFFSEFFEYNKIHYVATLHASARNGYHIDNKDIEQFNHALNHKGHNY